MFIDDDYKIDWEMCTIYLRRHMTSKNLRELLSKLPPDANTEDSAGWTIIVVTADN